MVTVHQKQETRGSDNPVEIGTVNGLAKCKKKWPGKSGKKSHFAVDVSSSSQSSVETSDSDSEGDTEALLSTCHPRRDTEHQGWVDWCCHSLTKRESWTVWFAQFEAIADDNDWSGPERLSMLLPKLQGGSWGVCVQSVAQENKIWTIGSWCKSWMHATARWSQNRTTGGS